MFNWIEKGELFSFICVIKLIHNNNDDSDEWINVKRKQINSLTLLWLSQVNVKVTKQKDLENLSTSFTRVLTFKKNKQGLLHILIKMVWNRNANELCSLLSLMLVSEIEMTNVLLSFFWISLCFAQMWSK